MTTQGLWLASLTALMLSYAGMAGLCLAMGRHFEQITGRYEPPPALRVSLRTIAAVLLGLALLGCLGAWGSGVGWVAWLGFLTAGALLTAAGWSWWPWPAAITAVVVGTIGLVIGIGSLASH